MNARTTAAAAPDAIAVWDLPSVSGKSVQARRPGPTVGELEAIERRAYEEAYAAGREAGLTSARAETDQAVEQLQAYMEIGRASCRERV